MRHILKYLSNSKLSLYRIRSSLISKTIFCSSLSRFIILSPTISFERNSAGIDKNRSIFFIDQVIAGELIEKVTTWYEGLKKLPDDTGMQKIMEKNQDLIVGIVHNFTPVLLLSIYHYYFTAFCSWGNLTTNLSIGNIQFLLITFITVFFIGSMFAKRFAKWTDKKIDDYKGLSPFEITKGDENAVHEAQINNSSVTKQILTKVGLTILTTIVAFAVRYLLTI